MDGPTLTVKFYRSEAGKEPVRDFLRALATGDRRITGSDIKLVQFGWPLGMPLVRKLHRNLWEVRSVVSDGIVRILFTVHGDHMVLLHALVKKSQKLPSADLKLALTRLRKLQEA
jgi:phage-related protein